MPTMNPDGFEYEYKQTIHAQGPGRLNANKIALNRNFPKVQLEHLPDKNDIVVPKQNSENGGNRLDKLSNIEHHLEPEVRAVMHWSLIYPFVLSGNLHGGALVANYPFDNRISDSTTKESKSPDEQTFQMLARSYSHVNDFNCIFSLLLSINFVCSRLIQICIKVMLVSNLTMVSLMVLLGT